MTHKSTEDEFHIPGPFRRYGPMMGAIVVAFICAPFLNRALDNYRAVVLEAKSDTAYLGLHDRPPEWVDATGLKAGMIVSKELGGWDLLEAPVVESDKPLQEMYDRYSSTWFGTVIKLQPRNHPQAADTAVVKRLDGSKHSFPIWAEHLVTLDVGSRLKKLPGTWDPVLMTREETFPVGFQVPQE